MKERIQQILAEKNLSASKFAEKIDVQPSGISHILSGRNKPGMDFIVKCLNAFPDINPDWFVLGNGPMYRRRGASEAVVEAERRGALGNTENRDKQDRAENFPDGAYHGYLTSDMSGDLFSSLNSEEVKTTLEASKSYEDCTENSCPVRNFAADKRIQRVMIFYSDRTVESFDYSENSAKYGR